MSTVQSGSDNDDLKVQMFSKDNFEGNIYEINYGNYTSNMFTDKLTPDNVFSLTIPPMTTVKMYSGIMYNYDGIGAVSITNVSSDTMKVPQLPDHIRGNIRSISITRNDSDSVDEIIDASLLTQTILSSPDLNDNSTSSYSVNYTPSNSYSDIGVRSQDLISNTAIDSVGNTVTTYNNEQFNDDGVYNNSVTVDRCFYLMIAVSVLIILLFMINIDYKQSKR